MEKQRRSPEPQTEPQGPKPVPQVWQRVVWGLIVSGLCVLMVGMTVFKMSNNDIWIHLKTGEIIVKTGQVPDKDPYSFSASHRDYIAYEWLAGVVFYLIYAAAGVKGLTLFKAAIVIATCTLLLLTCRLMGARLFVAMPCLMLMLLVASARFFERPQIFSYFFTALYLYLYFAFRRSRRRALLYAIPVLHVLWTNLHGAHLVGVFLLVVLAAADVASYVRARLLGFAVADALPGRDVALVCAVPVLSLVAAFINPYGYRLLTLPFELTGMQVFMRGPLAILEWQSSLHPTYNGTSMFFFYIGWTVLLFGSFFRVRDHSELQGGWRDRADVANRLLVGGLLIFAVQLGKCYETEAPGGCSLEAHPEAWYGLALLFLVANLHRLEFAHAAIVALFFALSLRYSRAVTDAALATFPTLVHNLSAWIKPAALPPRVDWSLRAVGGVAMLALGIFTLTNGYYYSLPPHSSTREGGLGIADNMPVGAVDYIQANDITGNCFTSYDAAAMLIHRMWPEVKVSMDSRCDVYGPDVYSEYMATLRGGAALQAYMEKWPIDCALITRLMPPFDEFFDYFETSPEWATVYRDDLSIVYVKRQPRFKAIIDRDGPAATDESTLFGPE